MFFHNNSLFCPALVTFESCSIIKPIFIYNLEYPITPHVKCNPSAFRFSQSGHTRKASSGSACSLLSASPIKHRDELEQAHEKRYSEKCNPCHVQYSSIINPK